ncbi:Yos1-like family protein [Babesia bovis T2Bo]|uniref:Membrane protein, putative n=1 Tax=Babesia bovis TaxID=5865 RepID=A7AQA1_BABBO|nr:Yos1-like family protein [Babesia bovis T2Bo]EDO08735.1 Yos1-like family protein [Babesia bovis T2Bo]|eukprot:XP_001612303.1 membrane protein [Babesia bovis T2Bo]
MSFSFLHLIEAAVLILNGMGILNERRVLKPLGLDKPSSVNSFRNHISVMFFTVRTYLRVFLILINFILILFELVLG